jgi:acetylornithine deacetylase
MNNLSPKLIRECVESLRDELVELAPALVRCPSVTGEEAEAQELLASRWREWGLAVDRWIPKREDVSSHPAFCDDGLPIERPNLVARWGDESPKEPAALILNGHIDVVPVGDSDQWDSDPFGGRLDRGTIYGRGACDMKGGLAAASMGVRAAQKLGVAPKRPVLLQSVIGEETGGLGTLAAILRGYRADAAVIAEPTSLAMCPVQSGALSFRLHVPGRSAHGAIRQAGVSAIEKFWPIWQALRDFVIRRHRDFHHPMYDGSRLAAPLSIGKLRAGNWLSTVPEETVAEGRFGVLPEEECDDARSELEAVVREASRGDSWLRQHPVRVEWFEGQFEPGETDPSAAILHELAEAHRAVTDRELRSHGVPYGSDLRLFTRYAKVPAVLYGPGDVQLAHAVNESVPVDELLVATQVLATLICGKVAA